MADKVKIYERLFDNQERGDNGKGKFLGEFYVVKQIREGIYLDQFIGKDTDGRLFFVDGEEVCGYGGGMRYEICDLELTAADVAPVRHGTNIGQDYAECDQFVCSKCGIELQSWMRVERDLDDGEITYHECTFRYCPNCGAKIDRDEV